MSPSQLHEARKRFRATKRGRARSETNKPMSLFGRVFITLFLSIFIVAGVFVGIKAVEGAQRRTEQMNWDQVPCKITRSRVQIDPTSNEPYSPDIAFRYERHGRVYQSDSAIEGGVNTNDYSEAQDLILKYPAGSTQTAMVNPNGPGDAVLEPESAAASYLFLLLPVVFSGIPLVILFMLWKPGNAKDKPKAISSATTSKELGPKGYLAIGLLLLTVGIGVGIPLAILPIGRTVSAMNWVQTPCVVERSAVLTFDGEDGNTYRPDILYRYEFDGQTYRSNRLHLATTGSSSGYDGKREVADAHPVGHETVCYVDPDRPSRATLNRGFNLAHLLGLIPLVFFLGGLALMFSGIRKLATPRDWRTDRIDAATGDAFTIGPASSSAKAVDAGPVVLRPRMSRLGKAIGLLFFSLFWNGIVSIFVYQVVQGYAKGSPDFCLTAFMIPFVVVGLVLIGAFVQATMVVFAPVIELELDRRSLPLGGSTTLRWRVLGRPGRLHGLTITLVGTESARYRRGTDTITDTHDFYTEHLVGGEHEESDTTDPMQLPIDSDSGERTLVIPADTMHSFDGGNNKVVWKLKVRAWVPRWPDPKDEYEVDIQPMGVEGG